MGLSASTLILLLSLAIFMALSISAFGKNLPVSAVSATPSSLTAGSGSEFSSTPAAAAAPPALSPDISPLLPSVPGGGSGLSPTESSLPIIPSNPSPPNPGPGGALSPGPSAAFAPMGMKPESSSPGLSVPGFLVSVLGLFLVLLLMH